MRGWDTRRHSVVISEAPVMAPLVPLAEFVSGVGPAPPRAALHTYLARLREQARLSVSHISRSFVT